MRTQPSLLPHQEYCLTAAKLQEKGLYEAAIRDLQNSIDLFVGEPIDAQIWKARRRLEITRCYEKIGDMRMVSRSYFDVAEAYRKAWLYKLALDHYIRSAEILHEIEKEPKKRRWGLSRCSKKALEMLRILSVYNSAKFTLELPDYLQNAESSSLCSLPESSSTSPASFISSLDSTTEEKSQPGSPKDNGGDPSPPPEEAIKSTLRHSRVFRAPNTKDSAIHCPTPEIRNGV